MALPMRHAVEREATGDGAPGEVRYAWRQPSGWSALSVRSTGAAQPLVAGSEAEFITEHYWGYTRQRDGGTVEYKVTHPRWRTWTVTDATLSGDLVATYGQRFAAVLAGPPSSAMLAEGSPISVHRPARVRE